MNDIPSSAPEICIVGRTNARTGMGQLSASAAEVLARFFSVAFYPLDSSNPTRSHIELPSGRRVPVCRDLSGAKAVFFAEVLWNGAYDSNYTVVPQGPLRIAHMAYDSDVLPPEWVEILNARFDVAYFTSRHLEQVAKDSGVGIAIGTLPLALDLDSLLSRSFVSNDLTIRFGTVSAFHPRKRLDILVKAFALEFASDEPVELVVHSNLAHGDTYEELSSLVARQGGNKVRLSKADLAAGELVQLIENLDVFVNCSSGEGYSIPARQAMALGKVLVLSEVGPHMDLLGINGTFGITPTLTVPARYPEIDDRVFGEQRLVTIEDTRGQLREAYELVKSGRHLSGVAERKARASEFSYGTLALNYAATIKPHLETAKPAGPRSLFARVPPDCRTAAAAKLGRLGSQLAAPNRRVVPAHDGGFFSVFNIFMMAMVWDLRDDRCHMVLPDWDVGRLVDRAREGGRRILSFCYGTPADGNIWTQFFEPLYGLSVGELHDEEFLYGRSTLPPHPIGSQDPRMTYVNAGGLYRSLEFSRIRKLYHTAFRNHVRALPQLQAEVDEFSERHLNGRLALAAHVKHPSHVVEQPTQSIAQTQTYVAAIRTRLQHHGIAPEDKDWTLFLATDRDRVLEQFQEEFGANVVWFPDARRTTVAEDQVYDGLSAEERAQEGHMVQHVVAASPSSWSTRMSWEVLRDAMVIARTRTFFHVVSNVATAVSFMNPDLEMIYLERERFPA